MSLHLVRHAKAGRRERWEGPDEVRPLSARGREQADALAVAFADVPVSRVLSSPALRCLQTVAPVAAKHGLEVESCPQLAEGAPFEPALELLLTLPDHAVLCTHGDVVLDVVSALERRGMELRGAPDWRKASRWVLDRDGSRIVCARAVPPPA